MENSVSIWSCRTQHNPIQTALISRYTRIRLHRMGFSKYHKYEYLKCFGLNIPFFVCLQSLDEMTRIPIATHTSLKTHFVHWLSNLNQFVLNTMGNHLDTQILRYHEEHNLLFEASLKFVNKILNCIFLFR